jgi:hypothetical protein
MSNATLGVLNRHFRLEARHAFALLKAIMARMKGDDIFGGRIPEGRGLDKDDARTLNWLSCRAKSCVLIPN